ncbi:MAG: hypothetical protein JWN08_1786 [Frankiales bacterium]|nr:hypothetical protein [Frankiales bacterium]
MPLTPQSQRLLDRFAEAGVLPFDRMSVLEARASVAAGIALQGAPVEVAQVRDVLADGPAGRLPVRVYDDLPGTPARPLLVFFHGGGWVTGSVEGSDATCRALAIGTGCVVASVEYRLAPETRFPGPAHDAFAATAWLVEHAPDLGADPARVVVGGDSAGGNLAAATALMARDRGGPLLAGQVLLYPPLAPPRGSPRASLARNAEGYGLTRGGLERFWDLYLAQEADGLDPYASPLLADDLSGLPPTLVVTAEYDPLHDEGQDFAQRLRESGTDVKVVDYDGLVHGFLSMARVLPEGRAVVGVIAAWIDRCAP